MRMSPSSETKRWPGVLLFVLVMIAGLSVDLWSKWVSFDHPTLKLADSVVRDPLSGLWVATDTDAREVRVLPGWFHFRATVNEGAVFGLGQGRRAVFVVVSVLAMGVLIYMLTKTPRRIDQAVLGCLAAGAMGNMIDRVWFGYVRDMLFALPGVRWPGTWQVPFLNYPHIDDRLVFPWIFNVADVLLVCGVCYLLARGLLDEWQVARAKKSQPAL
jgi:lipoprotein signal peptidase